MAQKNVCFIGYFLYILALGIHIAIYILARKSYDKLIGTEFEFFQQLTRNWITEPIKHFDAYNNQRECPANQDLLIRSNFSGIVRSCDCSKQLGYVSPKKCNRGKNSREKRCTDMSSTPEIRYHAWAENTLCAERIASNFLDDIIVSKPDSCPKNTRNCGIADSLGNYLCINELDDCPINSFIIGKKSAGPDSTITANLTNYNSQTKEYTFITKDYTYVFNQELGYADFTDLSSYNIKLIDDNKAIFYKKTTYTLSSSFIPKIITYLTVSDDTPCFDEFYWNTYPREYILLKSFNRGTCARFPIEDREAPNPKNMNYVQYNTDAIMLDKDYKNDFLDDNDITRILLKLPLYTAPPSDVTTSLYGNKFIGISQSCRDLINLNYDDSAKMEFILSLEQVHLSMENIDGYVNAANICSLIVMIISIVFTIVVIFVICMENSNNAKMNVVFYVAYFGLGFWDLIICAVAAGRLNVPDHKNASFLIDNNCLDAQAHTIIDVSLKNFTKVIGLSKAAAVISAVSFFVIPVIMYFAGIVSKENYFDDVQVNSGMIDHENNENAGTANPDNVVIENVANQDNNNAENNAIN